MDKFTQGSPGAVRKLNTLIEAVEKLLRIKGDGKFIKIDNGTGDPVVSLNINAILPRIPKPVLDGPTTVLVKKDGGADAADNTHKATYTYSIYRKSDSGLVTAIATGLTPKRARWNGFMVAAANGTYGLADTDASGNWILLEALDEARRTQPCT